MVKYYSFKWKCYSLYASQESPKIVARKTMPAKIDTIQCFMPIRTFTKITIFSPNLLKTDLISCDYCILWTLFLDIKHIKNSHICSVMWKCQQERFPSRIDNSPNKSLGTPVKTVELSLNSTSSSRTETEWKQNITILLFIPQFISLS